MTESKKAARFLKALSKFSCSPDTSKIKFSRGPADKISVSAREPQKRAEAVGSFFVVIKWFVLKGDVFCLGGNRVKVRGALVVFA